MKRTFEGDIISSASVTAKESPHRTTEIDSNSSIEKIPDCEKIDLEPFEKSSQWSDDYLEHLNIQRRPFDFQIEIVQSVIKSGNSIICLRTGAGKTYISALLIKYYYMKKRKEKSKNFLAFFFVPNRSIREQQVTAIDDVGDLNVVSCDDDYSANEFLSDYINVVVCTPQKFLNCLIDKTIHLNQVDLLVFDECHNCIGNHPYSKIMEHYLVYHRDNNRLRILCLTASCGTKLTNPKAILEELEDTNNRKQNALTKLYELCATLNCFDVVTVTKAKHIKELNEKVHQPTDDRILTVKPSSFDRFLLELKEKLTKLLEYIGSQCAPVIAALTDEQKLVEEKQKAEKANYVTNVILITYMIMFVKRFNALSDLPLKSIFNDIITKLELFYAKKETPMEIETKVYNYCLTTVNDLVEQFKANEYYLTNPKLDFLRNLLREQIENRDQNARGLLLVSRTLYAKLMCDYFQESEDVKEIIKPCWLVGQSGADYQNSLIEQDMTLKDFRQGLSNVMIATDIVQEGLDVPECSFVIRYEFVSNEIGTVQSRGRARAEKSSCYLVVEQNSDNHRKETTNRLKENEMLEALNDWKQKSTNELRRNIVNVQNRIIREWRLAADLERRRRAALDDPIMINGKISCRSCDYYLGEISWIRKRSNNYFVPQQQINQQTETERYSVAKIYKEIQVNGIALCGNKQCRENLGGVQQYSDRPDLKEICVLQCKQLKFSFGDEDDEKRISTFKKWNDVTFKIPEIEPLTLNNTVST